MPFPKFIVSGASRPLRLEPGHAESIGGVPYIEPGSVPYVDQKVPSLRAEIARRNEGRDDDGRIPATGRKATLVAALEADDAAQAEQVAE